MKSSTNYQVFGEIHGSGDVILLLHPFPFDHRIWGHQVNQLSAKYSVVVVDLPGFGQSKTDSPPIKIDDHAHAVAHWLDAHNVKQATIVGLSMGGYIALAFAEYYPQRLQRFVLANSRVTADSELVYDARNRSIEEIQKNGSANYLSQLLPKLISQSNHNALLSHLGSIARDQPVISLVNALTAMRDRPDRTHVLRHLRKPVLCIGGENDGVTPIHELKLLADQVPNAKLVEIPGAGHLSHIEHPAAFNLAIEEFMSS